MEIELFESFPREIGPKRLWCNSIEEYNNFLKIANGVLDCRCSVYRQTIRKNEKDYGDALESGAVLDKVFLDFDSRFGYESMLVAHEILDEMNVVHRVLLSARWSDKRVISKKSIENNHFVFVIIPESASCGFHVYFWINPFVNYKKQTLFNLHKYMSEEVGKRLKTGWGIEVVEDQWIQIDEKTFKLDEWELQDNQMYTPVDRCIWGDLLRMGRIPNTWNTKRGRFCIPLSEKMIENKTPHQLNEISKKQLFLETKKIYFGTKIFDASRFDVKSNGMEMLPYSTPPVSKLKTNKINVDNFPPCIRVLMSNPDLDNRLRIWLIVYFRERGISMDECIELLRSFMSPGTFQHTVYSEEKPRRIYEGNQRKLLMKDCFFMMNVCNCFEKCRSCNRWKFKSPVYGC